MRRALGAVLVMLAAVPAAGAAQETQLERLVENKLVDYGYHVDATTLSQSQLTQLHFVLNSEGPRGVPGQKRIRIEGILNRGPGGGTD